LSLNHKPPCMRSKIQAITLTPRNKIRCIRGNQLLIANSVTHKNSRHIGSCSWGHLGYLGLTLRALYRILFF
jgi:hypothetical protein